MEDEENEEEGGGGRSRAAGPAAPAVRRVLDTEKAGAAHDECAERASWSYLWGHDKGRKGRKRRSQKDSNLLGLAAWVRQLVPTTTDDDDCPTTTDDDSRRIGGERKWYPY